jgi:hypothetical protein
MADDKHQATVDRHLAAGRFLALQTVSAAPADDKISE